MVRQVGCPQVLQVQQQTWISMLGFNSFYLAPWSLAFNRLSLSYCSFHLVRKYDSYQQMEYELETSVDL